MRGPFVKVDKIDPDTVFSWPNLLIAELFVLLLTIAGVMLVSILFNAPLEQPVNVMHPPNPAKAPWYFLGLQEQVSYSAFWGGIGVPGIELLLLVLLPLLRSRQGRRRTLVCARAGAGEFNLSAVRDRERDSDRDWHFLPRRELAVRVPFLKGFLPEEFVVMRMALAVVSLVVLVGSGVVVYDQFQSRWEDNQRAYFHQALDLAKTPAEKAALEQQSPKLEQTIVTAFGEQRIDRCQSCHIAVDDPRFSSANEPLRTHPYSAAMGDVLKNGRWERRHKFTDFGCTVCHDGQGRGLDTADAHGEDPSWPTPMMGYTTQAGWNKTIASHLQGKEFMQANCAQCHTDKDFAGTPEVKRGRELFFKTGCYGCHRMEGLSAGTLGPDLTEVGKERKIDYLWGHIVNPRDYTPTSIMPQFKLSDDDRKALVIFLKSRRGPNAAVSSMDSFRLDASKETPVPESVGATALNAPPATTAAARGAQLIQGYACLSCHKLGDRDGGISPDLSYEGLLRDQPWLMDHFHNPRSRVPDSNMPVFGLPDAEFQDITTYLLTLDKPPAPVTAEQTYKNLCARCHGDKGDGHGINCHLY